MNKIAAASLLICLSHSAHADINMMEASFKTTFIDLQTGSAPTGWKVSRTYDSRSTFSGLFGFGWCSNLDVSVVKHGQTVAVNECGKSIRGESLTLTKNKTYVRKKTDGITETFAADDGRLTGITLPGHKEVQVLRARHRRTSLPQATAAEEGKVKRREVLLELDDSDRVIRIESTGPDSPPLTSSFQYGPEGNLLFATNAWNNAYHFTYDRLHNLTLISYPDNTFEKLTFDSDRDRVTSFQGRNGCIENYNHSGHKDSKHRSLVQQTSVAILNCPGAAPTQTTFDFQYAQRADRRWALAGLRLTTADGRIKTLKYKLGGLK